MGEHFEAVPIKGKVLMPGQLLLQSLAPQERSAYLNLLEPRDMYLLDLDNTKGCLEVLKMLLPSSWM